ncbi:MAG: type II and III secretion system protein family protein [Pseudomonadota bacterium]
MRLLNLFAAGLLAVSAAQLPATVAEAQSNSIIKVTTEETSESVLVPLNRAVVLESDVAFAELSVANPGIADIATLSDRSIYVLGKSPGRTTLTLLGADGRLITNVDVVVNPNLSELKELIDEIMPNEKIEIRSANDGIVLSGVASGTRTLARMVELAERFAPGRVTNLATVGGRHQVMLKVRFAEMSRTVGKGISGSVSVSSSDTFGETGGLIGLASRLADGNTNNDFIELAGDTTGYVTNVFNLGSTAVSVLFEALENKGLVRTLAEPNLVTISGNEAAFLAGGEYPFPTTTDGDTVIEFKEFGVGMRFTPTVFDDKQINLVVQTEVSSLDTGTTVSIAGQSVPTLSVRRAETTVEMFDGQSIAIAGLLQDNFSDAVAQVPFLADIPVLGALFRSSSYQREQSELVIIITAHLVSPTDGGNFLLPTDRVRPPTEGELFLLGRTAGGRAAGSSSASSAASQDFTGSYGYVLE